MDSYFRWLKGLVNGPGPLYNILFYKAWDTIYEFYIPNDDNRAEDGLMLRSRFEDETSIMLPDLGECRMLEFLIGLAIRINEVIYNYNDPDQINTWFWKLLHNLQLDVFDDNYIFKHGEFEIDTIFMKLNRRLYHADGSNGGLFPLEYAPIDQKSVEIWYQMMAYLNENL